MKGGVGMSMQPLNERPLTKRNAQKGFTIIELMIATLVFSFILIVITTGIMSFTRQYYKGVISSNTQGAARAIIDDVTRAIQFNGGGVVNLTAVESGTPTGSPPYGYCIGPSKRYSFALGRQITDSGTLDTNQSRHALLLDNLSATTCTTATGALNAGAITSLPPNTRELLGEHMRLARFSITPDASSNFYTITVRVVYGDDDLLCSPSTAGDCDRDLSDALNAQDLTCKSLSGSQFCAVSELSTTVKKRVN